MKKLLLILSCLLLVNYAFSQKPATESGGVTMESRKVEREPGIIISPVNDQVYTGTPFTPELVIRDGSYTLQKNKDYTLTYQNNVNVGVATITIVGKGNYKDNKELKFNITAKSINQLQINPIKDQTFRNAAIQPDILLKDGARILGKDTDYTVNIVNNTNVGTATVTITGKGNYKDSKTLNFRIVAKSMSQAAAGGRR